MRRKDFVAGVEIWHFADYAATQGVSRVGGMSLKGVFTGDRQPLPAAHLLCKRWTDVRT